MRWRDPMQGTAPRWPESSEDNIAERLHSVAEKARRLVELVI